MFNRPAAHHKLLLLYVLIMLMLSASAGPLDTTVKKNLSVTSHNSYNTTYSVLAAKEIVADFREDNTDRAMHLLASFCRNAESEAKICRNMNFIGLEIINMVLEADNSDLSPSEKRVASAFMKALFLQNEQGVKKVRHDLKSEPASFFISRFKLLMDVIGEDKDAGKELDKILLEHPDLLSANALKAQNLYDRKKYNECIQYCTNAVSLSPNYAYAFALRANCYAQLNEPVKAVVDFDAALKLFPQNNLNEYDRATALMDIDKYQEAIPGLLKMHYTNPGYSWTYYNLARCYYKINKSDSALYFVNLHIKEYPNDDDGYDLKGDVLNGHNEYQDAVEQYTQAIQLTPKNASFYDDRGDAYFNGEKYAEALADYQKAIQIDKHLVYAIDRVGDCYFQLKDYHKSVLNHMQAIKIDPAYKYAWVGVSMSKVELGDYQDAIAACKKAIAIDSTYDTALGDLGWDYYCAGDNDACIAYSYKALQYDKSATYAMFNIALATLKKGDVAKAKTLYAQFIAECKEKGYPILDGAIDDLKDLIKKHIAVDDCKFIIENIFQKEI